MRIPKWTESKECQSGSYCSMCRDVSLAGEHWRKAISAGKRLPGDNINFACPFGVPWGFGKLIVQNWRPKFMPAIRPVTVAKPVQMGLGTMIERLVKPFAKMLSLGCLQPDGSLKPDSPCAKRRDELNAMSVDLKT